MKTSIVKRIKKDRMLKGMKDGITLEVCIENGGRIDELIGKDVDRVELCDNLAVGGTTVSWGTAENVIARCHTAGIRVMSMIRPRGGNFAYSADELAVMLRDIEMLKTLGTDGVVFGCLTKDKRLDEEAVKKCIAAAGNLETTFHMAFDHIAEDEQLDALRRLAELGITRVLTHGSADLSVPIQLNYPRLRKYITSGGVEILAGGGVTKDNYREICAALGVTQVHGTRIV